MITSRCWAAREGDIREPSFGLLALARGLFGVGDLQRAAVRQRVSSQANSSTRGHWRPLAPWIVASSMPVVVADLAQRIGARRQQRAVGGDGHARRFGFGLVEHLELDPLRVAERSSCSPKYASSPPAERR